MFLRLVICFIAGSIPVAVIAMVGSGIDIRKVGSGNPGFNNVLRVSKSRAVIALIGDMGKGLVAVWAVLHLWPPLQGRPSLDSLTLGWLCGFAAVLGHCFSPFLKFNGGKGIATSGGVMLLLYPAWAVMALVYFAVFRVAAARLKWPEAGALASLTSWLLFALLLLAFVGPRDATYAGLMFLFLGWRHKKNLQNLLAAA